MKEQKFIIKGELPTMNDIIEINRRNKYAAAEHKKKWDNIVAWNCTRIDEIIGKADFEITYFMSSRRKDKDNIHAGTKFIFDGLQKAGKMKNDGWNEVGNISYFYEVDKKKPRVEVVIKERQAEVK